MKGRRHHKMSGGEADFGEPKDTPKADLEDKPRRYNLGKASEEAEEKKRGGRAKRKHGGGIHKHHEKDEHMKHAKHLVPVHGDMHKHAGRAPRKSGGKTGSNNHPLSSAAGGTSPRDHKTVDYE